MKIKETSLSMGRTINLGNFESLRLDLSITVDLAAYDNSDPSEYETVVRGLETTLSRNLDAVASRQTGQVAEDEEEFV
jgi:hypothetical protein